MPALPPVANCAKLVVEGHLGDAQTAQVFHIGYSFPAPLNNADAFTINDAFEEAWETNILPGQSHDYTLDQFVLTDLHTLTGVQNVIASGTAGGVGTASAPAECCVVTTFLTAFRGRSFRGRTYLPGVAMTNLHDPQHWNAGVDSSFNTSYIAVNAALGALAHPCGFEVVSYFGPPTILAGAIAPGNPKRRKSTLRPVPLENAVTGFRTSLRIGSQRRRGL
jgi:hypothetical protein